MQKSDDKPAVITQLLWQPQNYVMETNDVIYHRLWLCKIIKFVDEILDTIQMKPLGQKFCMVLFIS